MMQAALILNQKGNQHLFSVIIGPSFVVAEARAPALEMLQLRQSSVRWRKIQ